MKYRNKPAVIEAVQFVSPDFYQEIINLIGKKRSLLQAKKYKDEWKAVITTLEGDMIVEVGDWIIKGVKGEFYPVKSDVFELSYEKVKE